MRREGHLDQKRVVEAPDNVASGHGAIKPDAGASRRPMRADKGRLKLVIGITAAKAWKRNLSYICSSQGQLLSSLRLSTFSVHPTWRQASLLRDRPSARTMLLTEAGGNVTTTRRYSGSSG